MIGTWAWPSSFRPYSLYSAHELISTHLAWSLGIVSMEEGIYLFYLCVDCLALLRSKVDPCTLTPASHFVQTDVGWMSANSWPLLETGEKNSCCCVSHQGPPCAWRMVYYVEGVNQGTNWKGIEAWMELGSLGLRETAHVFLFTWWLRSKFPVCNHSIYQEAKTLDLCLGYGRFTFFSHLARPVFIDKL